MTAELLLLPIPSAFYTPLNTPYTHNLRELLIPSDLLTVTHSPGQLARCGRIGRTK